MLARSIGGSIRRLSLYRRFPRSNRKYITPNTTCTAIVPFGSNLGTTVGMPRYTIILQHMVTLTHFIEGIIVGILLSDGWLRKQNAGGQARLGFKQSLAHSGYF